QTECVNLGSIVTLDITISEDLIPIGGYDLLITYDVTGFSPLTAAIGSDISGWEYFTYRLDPLNGCSVCPSGIIQLIAIADVNNGANHPPVSQFSPDGVVARVSFRATSNANFAGYVYPVKFYWFECGDNGISTVSGDTLLVDKLILDPEFTIWDETDDILFPEASRYDGIGVPDTCIEGDKTQPLRCVTFVNGSICIIHNDSIDARGDINLNGLANEIGDAVLFTNYFLKGISVFTISVPGQTVATDINADGIPLQLGDLIYLLRIITGDALPIPKLSPHYRDIDLELASDAHGTTFTSVSNSDLGGLFLKVKLDSGVMPEIIPSEELLDLGFDYQLNGDILHLLIYSDRQDARIASGRRALFSLRGVEHAEVIHAEASDYYGSDIDVRVGKTTLPSGFELRQNFPNPFNPETQIALSLPRSSDWVLTIFNINGQLVRSFEGTSAAGVTTVTWDGNDLSGQSVATGVYLYRLDAGDFTDTKKMLLVK
ncbi:MAG: FlgD immunoglobulin-like domain containing protein, partial [bacterium]